ncbi:MAG TPA: hypothetical protein ENF75_06040 [Acidilobales archaeon]|nr:hypothetical protein [Acidilobales archaeon]
MPFIRKRELVIYYILSKHYGINGKFNIGDAYDVFKWALSRKVFRNVIKRLVKYGLIERLDRYVYVIKPLDNYLDKLMYGFLCSKLMRYAKSIDGQITCYSDEFVITLKDSKELDLIKWVLDRISLFGVKVRVHLPPQKSQQQS